MKRLKSAGDRLDEEGLRQFMMFTNDLDLGRNQSFRESFPELLGLIEESGVRWDEGTRFATPGAGAGSAAVNGYEEEA